MKKRPGFISATGIAAAIVLIAAVAVWAIISGHAMFSPGGLNAETSAAAVGGSASGGQFVTLGGVSTHAALEHHCSACHPAPWSSQTMADRCLDCHTGIARQLTAAKSLHGTIAGTPADPTCRGCHPEHHGPHGALTSLDEATFPHDVTGFSLRTHQRMDDGSRFTCADCHPKDYEAFDQAICVDCHHDLDAVFTGHHADVYGTDCLGCHDGNKGLAGFDHDTTGYPLTGKHVDVDCSECHKEGGVPVAAGDAPHDCYACHQKDDEHDGAFGRQCGDCHKTSGWEDATFDHDVFPLDHGSEERTATCETCHPNGTTTYTCYGCHEHTPANVFAEHEGRSLASLADCVRCHPGGSGGEGD